MSTAVDIETVACWFLSLKPGCKGSASTYLHINSVFRHKKAILTWITCSSRC